MKSNKGITLIALVITIIVMLILVSVTIRAVQDGKLFTYAGNAVKDTKQALEEENKLSNLEGVEETVAGEAGSHSSQEQKPRIISFTIEGVEYHAISGMTWREWVNDETYNTGGFLIYEWVDGLNQQHVKVAFPNVAHDPIEGVTPDSVIEDGGTYVKPNAR